MERLALTSRILYDYDLLEKNKELRVLKAAIARELFDGNLQHNLEHVNEDIVHCGCPGCVELQGSNYPIDRVYPNFSNDGYSPLEDGSIAVPLNKCLLYRWFQKKCRKCQAPSPREQVDHPKHWPVILNLTQCLGIDNPLSTQESWKAQVEKLSYSRQVNTVYMMMHGLDHPKNQTFEEWFVCQGHSLLP
jgi:hypothetical protein